MVYASSAAVHGPAEPDGPGRHRRRGPAGPAVALRCLQGLQRAERPGLLARSRHHEHRPASLDGLRRGPRLRNDQRADQGDQVGGRRAGRTASATAASKTFSTWRTSPRRSSGRSTQPFEGADAFNLRGAVEPIERFVERILRGGAGGPRARQPRRPAAADRAVSRRQPPGDARSARSRARRCATGSPRLITASSPCATAEQLDLSDL